MAQELANTGKSGRVAGMLLIAPAPDFTVELMEPELTAEQRAALDAQGYFEEPSEYSDEPNIYTKALFEDGRKNRVLTGVIDTHCPVHILQGMADPDVPHAHAHKLVEHLSADDVTLTLIRDGDHRLSRPQDLALLTRSVEGLIALHK
jgi:pimeloyl-ACP methyl ester carboxylesterase